MLSVKRLLNLLVWLICAPFMVGEASAQQTLVIATNIYPPYVQEDIENSFLPALFDEIGKEMGVNFEYAILPWKRCEQSVADLQVWGAIPYTRNPDRETRFLFSNTIYVSDSKFFAYRDQDRDEFNLPPATYHELAELRRWRVGGVQGYYYQPLFEQAGIEADYALSEKQNFERLQLGRIDLFPAATTVGWHLIRQLFPPDIVANFYTLAKPLSDDGTLHLMTAKDHPDNYVLLERFNNALRTVQENGTFAQLVEKFGLVLRY